MKTYKGFFVSIFAVSILIFAVSGYAQDQRLSRADQELKELLDKADLIAVGKIISVEAAPKDMFSEDFNPDWQIATIEMLDVQMGMPNNGDKVQIVFPNNPNLVYPGKVELNEDQEYVFILQDLYGSYALKHPEKIKKDQYYLILNPQRVQPKKKWTKIKELIY